MTTLTDIATRAYRSLGVIGAGQVASGQKATDALEKWQEQLDDLPGLRKGRWTEVLLTSTAAYEASDGERINTLGYAATITLPVTREDEAGATIPQLDLSRVQIIGGDQAGLYIYAASLGAWAQIDALTMASVTPFGPEDTAGLVALLAVRLAPEFGEQAVLSSVVTELAGRQLRSFRARFRREVSAGVDSALLVMSDTGQRGMTDPLGW